MKKILETPERSIYVDGDSLIKTGPAWELDWEAGILDVLKHVHGVPHVRGLTTVLGGVSKMLAMDLIPGTEDPATGDRGVIAPQLLNILGEIYQAGIVHMRVRSENILVSDGLVGLIGFSKACILEANPMALFSKSPDMIGSVDGFTLRGLTSKPKGCYADWFVEGLTL